MAGSTGDAFQQRRRRGWNAEPAGGVDRRHREIAMSLERPNPLSFAAQRVLLDEMIQAASEQIAADLTAGPDARGANGASPPGAAPLPLPHRELIDRLTRVQPPRAAVARPANDMASAGPAPEPPQAASRSGLQATPAATIPEPQAIAPAERDGALPAPSSAAPRQRRLLRAPVLAVLVLFALLGLAAFAAAVWSVQSRAPLVPAPPVPATSASAVRALAASGPTEAASAAGSGIASISGASALPASAASGAGSATDAVPDVPGCAAAARALGLCEAA